MTAGVDNTYGHAIAGSGARESAFSVSNPPRAAKLNGGLFFLSK
jgi:hypothetical protein